MTEAEIINMLWEHSENALYVIDKEYGMLLRKLIYHIIGDNQDMEECLNDTYMAVWEAVPPNRPDYLRAYVCRIAKNIAMKRLREKMAIKRNSYNIFYIEELGECISDENIFASIEEKVLTGYIKQFLDKQSARDRVIFIKRYWFGYSVKEIAKELKMSEKHMSVILGRIRKKLKEYLKEEGYDEKL